MLDKEGVISGAPELVWKELVEYAEVVATALTGDDADGTRQRMLARLIVVERSRLALLHARTSLLLEAGQLCELDRLERVISKSSRRLIQLLDAHRRELHESSPRFVTLVHAAGDVRLPGE